MELRNDWELANTRKLLAEYQAAYARGAQETGGDEELREIELESLGRQIKEFKEDIARYEAHQPARR